jgi:hypothetical protein
MDKMSIKVLIIGNGNHQFIFHFVEWMKKYSQNAYEFDLLDTSMGIRKEYKHAYNTIYYSKKSTFLLKFRLLRSIYTIIMYNLKFWTIPKTYQIIHIQFVRNKLAYILFLKKKTKHLIASIWGSDFYRLKESRRNSLKKILDKADIITFTNKETYQEAYTCFNYNDQRYRIIRYGLQPLEVLKKLIETKTYCKIHFGIPENNIIITIGYNGRPEQNHIKILNLFGESNELMALKKDLYFIFPITYGGDQSYIHKLKEALLDFPYKYILLEKFLPDREIAYLRKATDIFIQLQPTDQLSGAMIEHMYAGNIVITGDWLPYSIIKRCGVYFRTISRFEYLMDDVRYCIQNLPEELQKVEMNHEKIYGLGGWPINVKGWKEIYDYLN